MTEVANPTLGKIEDAVERLGYELRVRLFLPALYSAVPFLGAWPFKQLIEYVVNRFSDEIFAAVRLWTDLKVIKLVNDRHQATFERDVLVLRVLGKSHGIDSPEFRKQYEEAHDAFAAFVKFNGA